MILQNLVPRRDGSFSGNTPAGHINGRVVRAYQVGGQVNGDVVTLTRSNEICPDRNGQGLRHSTGY